MRATVLARAGVLLALCVTVAGCERREPGLMQPQRGQNTPDEFAILPTKPIEIPKDLNALPAPTTGVANRTDVNPQAEAVAALGGNPARIQTDGKLGPDGALIRQTTRYGVDPQIRTDLAVADLEFRKRNRGRLMERLFGLTTYYDAYEREELNQHSTTWLYRSKGRATSAAPPDPEAN
ncbi:DUF3035 domain-containing protein [Tropicimonas sp. TH_r6]|uniref:DUF3035 domain-containing protein n=1 Tax=Tropicimonas sp. TH_r6 TaxID=3082085 RepID=UPI00295314D2|nr:DUF3035 domain-containing protein [Tropicimonas sp. TH_r6]MDV7141220.1 DUF3035 domain-containing protein [Tropicimonas sp. TH_r6]